jgi:capsid protein
MPVKAKAHRKQFDASAIAARPVVRASYDIARTTDENKNMWQYVDALSAAAANSPGVRKIVRERARYEVANNSYADGICDTLSSDTVGGEVQLQLGDSDLAQQTERDFAAWAREVRLWAKVRTMRRAKCVDGEAFAQFVTNRRLRNAVKLDVRPFECDLVESWAGSIRDDEIDGIRFDAAQNPVEYRVLKVHPGDHRITLKTLAGEWIDARYIMHYFSATRPGQVRGVSELLPALSLFGQLRMFTQSVLSCATRAAEITAVMQTTLAPDGSADLTDPVTVIEAQRNAITSLPEGWTLSQLKAEQPTTTYQMFKLEIINEIARCLSMPRNVAACDSSGYNYASGRLDHQTYDRSIDTEHYDLECMVCDRVYYEWLSEYAIAKRLTAAQVSEVTDHEWHFSGRGHVDPNKEASADDTRLKNGTLTQARYWAKQGADWKREGAQYIKERIELELKWNEGRKAAGLPPAPYPGSTPPKSEPATPDPEEDDDEQKTR